MTFAAAFLGCFVAFLVFAALAYTFIRHVVIPRLAASFMDFAQKQQEIFRGGPLDPLIPKPSHPAEPTADDDPDDGIGYTHEDIADILVTMTNAQRVTVLLLLSEQEGSDLLEAWRRAWVDANMVRREPFAAHEPKAS